MSGHLYTGYVLTSSGHKVRRKLAACPSPAAYRRHLRRDEQPCTPCCDASAAYRASQRVWRRARQAVAA